MVYLKKGSIKIAYLNIRSLRKNLPNIRCDEWYMQCDIIIFSETNTIQSDDEHLLKLDNFNIFYRSDMKSNSRNHKGIICYVKSNLNINILDNLLEFQFDNNNKYCSHIDLVCFECNNLVILTGYKSPRCPFNLFEKYLSKMATWLNKNQVIIIGDFNIDNYNNANQNLNDLMNTYDMHSVLKCDTITTDNNTQIDIIFTNIKNRTYVAGTYVSYFSDHMPIYILLDCLPMINHNEKCSSNRKQNCSNQNSGETIKEPNKKRKVVENDNSKASKQRKIDNKRIDPSRELLFSRTENYPLNFPNITIQIRGFSLQEDNFRSLLPDQWIDDNIINAFASIQVEAARARGRSVILLDSILTNNLLSGILSGGFKRWLAQTQLWTYKCWLCPLLIDNNHWILLVVDVKRKIMIYFDSLHHGPTERVVNRIFSFVHKMLEIANDPELVNNWSVYAPVDIPKQQDGINCGTHVCIRLYLICNELALDFDHDDTLFARPAISRILCSANIDREDVIREVIHNEMLDNINVNEPQEHYQYNLPINRTPPRGFSTSKLYCAKVFTE